MGARGQRKKQKRAEEEEGGGGGGGGAEVDVAAWAAALEAALAATAKGEGEEGRAEDLVRSFKDRFVGKGKGAALRQGLEAQAGPVLTRAWDSLGDAVRCALGLLESEEGLAVEALECVSSVLLAWLSSAQVAAKGGAAGLATVQVPFGLKRCARQLHDSLFELKTARDLQWKVSRICEQWWVLDLPDKGQLVTRALPVLTIFSLEDDAKRADVKRVFAVRKMLGLLDLDDDSSITLKQLLLRCFLSPLYLYTEDGRKFLGEVCCLNVEFVSDIHATIKTQLPYASASGPAAGGAARDSSAESYADVYFRAWQLASASHETAEVQTAIETEMVQDLMDAGVHVADPELARTVFVVLTAGFHDNKHVRGVDAMLLRLYNPILWRALNVANPTVRFNAARLLARAFPLQDPDASVADTDAVLQKQFAAIETLLRDACPRVRVAAVQGACRMLSVYWELIPKKAAVSLLSTLVGDLLRDANSAEVRVAVLRGLEFISENPLAQGALHDVLPHTSPLIHDHAKQVRTALLSLLIRVKSIRTIKFYEVVQVDHLLERLAMDVSLGSKLTKLLLDSFYPQGAKGSEQLARALALLKSHAAAATAFFTNVHRHVSVGSACKLALLLGKWIQNEVGAGDTPAAKRQRAKKKLKPLTTCIDGTPVLTGALRAVAAIWRSIASQLASKRYETARGQMREAFGFGEFVRPLLASGRFDGDRDMPALLEVAGQLPCDGDFAAEVAAELFAYTPKVTYEQYTRGDATLPPSLLVHVVRDLGPVLECLCKWGRTDKVVDSILASLQAAAGGAAGHQAHSKSSTAGRPSKTRKRGAKPDAAPAPTPGRTMDLLVALSCLQHLLANNPHGFREELLSSHAARTDDLFEALATLRAEPFALETLLKLALHREVFANAKEETPALLGEEDAPPAARGASKLPAVLETELAFAVEDLCLEARGQADSASNDEEEAKDAGDEELESASKKKKKRKSVDKAATDALRRKDLLLVSIAECTALGICAEPAARQAAASLRPAGSSRAAKRFGIAASA